MTTAPGVCVVKVGGSLLDYPRLQTDLLEWLRAETAGRHVVLIAGGGLFADGVRILEVQHRLTATSAHWLAVDTLKVTARLLCELLPDADLICEFAELRDRVAHPGWSVFDVGAFLRDVESRLPGVRLPHTWDVTSDSIAARLAVVLQAGELILLKSAPPPARLDQVAELSAAGYVDAFFPQIAGELQSLRLVCLRRANPLGGRS